MLPITARQCGDLLTTWLENSSGPSIAKKLASGIGYNDSPLFGAKKKKHKIVSELVIVNTALAIHAVNVVFEEEDVRPIIDAFLGSANKSVFSFLVSKDPAFRERYEHRIGDYFKILSEEKPSLGLSFLFIKSLDLDPLGNMQGQIFVAEYLSNSLGKSLDALKRFAIQSPNGR